jgi:hypothetical protein
MTGRDLITASLRKIGAVAPGESISASEATDGLAELNRMLSTWSTESLLVYTETQEAAFTLTPGDGTVTLGTSGDITTRPVKVTRAAIRDGSIDYPMDILTSGQYAGISNKSQTGIPRALFDDGGYPQRTLYLYPVPSEAKSLLLFTLRPLTAIASLDTAVSLPPGYEDALVYNLAIRLATEYGRPISQEVGVTANDSKAAIQRANYRPSLLGVDPALLPAGRRNIYTGRAE